MREVVNFVKTRPEAVVPTHGSEYAAGYDLYAAKLDIDSQDNFASIEIAPGQLVKIGTGIAVSFPANYFAGIYPRSGIATKQGLRLINCTGVIDADYRGELIVGLFNDFNKSTTVHLGDRIAQFILQPFSPCTFVQVNELDKTVRGEGGFGSTGVN